MMKQLTEKQAEIEALMEGNLKVSEVAHRCGLSESSIRKQIKRIEKKTGKMMLRKTLKLPLFDEVTG
jgi:DNA-binding CsgD family transcriptional regulator